MDYGHTKNISAKSTKRAVDYTDSFDLHTNTFNKSRIYDYDKSYYISNFSVKSAAKGNARQIAIPSFKCRPWVLNYDNFLMTGKKAINIYENFKLGNYLDLDGKTSDLINKNIRAQNLSFLDKLYSSDDQKTFIDYYCKLTGFPNLQLVAQNIENEFLNSVSKAESQIKRRFGYGDSSAYDVVFKGYDGVSSVAKSKALPGSDLDKAFVVIRGYKSNTSTNRQIVEDFKGALWENTDQRILSYNHDPVSFPKVYTIQQITDLNNAILAKSQPLFNSYSTRPMDINQSIIYYAMKYIFRSSFDENILKLVQKQQMQKFNTNYTEANPYFVKLCKEFPVSNDWNNLDTQNPSRENIYDFGFFIEAFLKGKHFGQKPVTLDKPDLHFINVSQIEALKNAPNGLKSKYIVRENLQNEFKNWDTNTQFRFIKTLIKAGCSDADDFPKYFESVEVDRFKSLMDSVGVKA